METSRYDLAGSMLEQSRRLLSDYKELPDWRGSGPELMPGSFRTIFAYDAIGRVEQELFPDGTTRKYTYHRDGSLNTVRVSTADGRWIDQPILKGTTHTRWDRKTSCILGNDLSIDYEYSAVSRRLVRLHTYSGVPGGARSYQDLHYTYDAAGNMIHSIDLAQQARVDVIRNLSVSTSSEFTYDAYYQLKQARGRAHQALLQYDYDPRSSGGFRGSRQIEP